MSDIKIIQTKNGIFRADHWEDLKKEKAKRLDAWKKNLVEYKPSHRFKEVVDYMQHRYNLDAGETSLMVRSLTHVLSQMKEVSYPGDILEQIAPINYEGGAGLLSLNYEQLDFKGQMKEITASSTDFPEITAVVNEFGRKVGVFAGAYTVTRLEAERAAKSGTSINANKARAAMMAAKKTKNNIFWNGSNSVTGLWNYDLNAVTINGAWATDTGEDIYDDVAGVFTSTFDATDGDFENDYLVFPSDSYSVLLKKFRTANTDKSLLRLCFEDLGVKGILKTNYLKSVTSAANSLSADRVFMALPRNPMVFEFMLPRDIQTFPAERNGSKFTTDLIFDTAGTFVYHPQAISYGVITTV